MDDVVRARAYVFWWIVGWESFTRTWESNRPYRAAIARRLSRTEARTSTKVHDIRAERVLGADGRVRLTVKLADVPDDAVFRKWQLDLDRRLRDTWGYHVRVHEDGTVTISGLKLDSAARFRELLEDAMKVADSEILALSQQRREEQAERETVEPVLKVWQSPPWIAGSRWGGLNRVTFDLSDRAAVVHSDQWSALLDSEDPPVKVLEATNFRLVVEGDVNEVIAALEAASVETASAIAEANTERDEEARAEETLRTDWEATVREAFWGPAS